MSFSARRFQGMSTHGSVIMRPRSAAARRAGFSATMCLRRTMSSVRAALRMRSPAESGGLMCIRLTEFIPGSPVILRNPTVFPIAVSPPGTSAIFILRGARFPQITLRILHRGSTARAWRSAKRSDAPRQVRFRTVRRGKSMSGSFRKKSAA